MVSVRSARPSLHYCLTRVFLESKCSEGSTPSVITRLRKREGVRFVTRRSKTSLRWSGRPLSRFSRITSSNKTRPCSGRSDSIGCAQCAIRHGGAHKTEQYFHTMPSATVVAEGHNRRLPLMPEFVQPRQDPAADRPERTEEQRKPAFRLWMRTSACPTTFPMPSINSDEERSIAPFPGLS